MADANRRLSVLVFLTPITSSSVQNNRGQDKSYQHQPLASVDIYSGYHKKPNLINNCFVIIYTSKEKMASKRIHL